MATIVPFNLLNTTTTTGIWTALPGNPTPSPIAPATYNGVLTFTDPTHAFGFHKYNYSVTDCNGYTSSSNVIINFGDSYPAANDECATGSNTPFPHTSLTVVVGTNADSCPGSTYTFSAEARPTTWNVNTDGDAWFRINYFHQPSNPTPVGLAALIDGTPFGSNGINNIQLAIYEGTTCGTMIIQDQDISNNQTASVYYSGDMTLPHIFWVRVSSETGNAGDFNLELQTV